MQMSSEGGEAIHVGSTEIETDYEHQNTHLLPVDSPFPGPCHFMLGRRKSLVYTTLSIGCATSFVCTRIEPRNSTVHTTLCYSPPT